MSEKKKILILGGGYGGVWAGKKLEKHFRHNPNVEITLVDKHPYHTLMTELHEVAGWRCEPESVQVSFKKIFGGKRINVVLDTIKKVDFEAKIAYSEKTQYPFDEIVVGVGAEPEFFGIPGIKENSFTLWSFEDAMKIRQHIDNIYREASSETDTDKRKKLLTFVVAGAGFTGIEMIGELLDERDAMCKKYYLDPNDVTVMDIEALPNIIPNLEEKLRDTAKAYLEKRHCVIRLGTPIVGAEPGKINLKDGSSVETSTFIWTCGVSSSKFGASLGLPVGKRNRIEADAEMKSPKYPFAYIVGDNSGYILGERPLAQIVETAHFTAEAAAKNIIADIDGGTERATFKPNYHGIMVSLGSHYGVANAMGIKTKGFWALFFKHMVNMWYLFNIAGFNQLWEYCKHEFLDIDWDQHRSFVGGFAGWRIHDFWAVLLRMWLGVAWFFEGLNKIGEGWLDFASGSKSGWMFSKGVVQAGVKVAADATAAATAAAAAPAAADATAAATAAVAAAAPAAADATAAATAAAAPAAAETVGKVFKAFWDWSGNIIQPTSGFATWWRHVFMDGICAYINYPVFQTLIVILEMLIGLALFGGCFTWIAAAVSCAMCVFFTFTGMFSANQAWFFFAGVLMLGGVGRSFGLDTWLVPVLKRGWSGTKFARKNHFYGGNPSK